MTLDQLLTTILPRFGVEPPILAFIDAANAVQDVIAQRLWLEKSDLLRTTLSGTLAIDASTYALASGTLGLAEWPWITNTEITPGRRVRPLDPEDRYLYTDSGHPKFFQQRGLTLTFYPPALIETTIKAEVYTRPAAFTLIANTIPWDGLFDQVFVEAVPRFTLSGGMITITQELESFIVQRVDMLVDHRPAKDIHWHYPA